MTNYFQYMHDRKFIRLEGLGYELNKGEAEATKGEYQEKDLLLNNMDWNKYAFFEPKPENYEFAEHILPNMFEVFKVLSLPEHHPENFYECPNCNHKEVLKLKNK